MKTFFSRLPLSTGLWVVLPLLVVLAGCPGPMSLAPPVPGGSLSISVPHIAAWASQLAKSQPAGSRAYILADAVKVEVKSDEGVDIIAPVTVEWTPLNDYNPAAPKVMSNISGIPVGTNYTVVVSIFNYAMSATEPQVRGETQGVAVSLGAVTPVSVICKPVNPITLTIDGGFQTAAIAPNGERWYVANLVQGQSYYFASEGPAALFNQDGVMINPFYVPHVATYTGPIYIGAVDFDGILGFTATGKTSIQLSTTQPVLNEGTVTEPVALTLDEDHLFKLAGSVASSPSYYSFTAGESGTYGFDSEFYYVHFNLYSDAGFTAQIAQGTDLFLGSFLGSLTSGTTYYLKLTNKSSYNSRESGRVMTPTAIGAAGLNEGTSGSPVALTLGAGETGSVGYHFFDTKSYYTFTTDANGHTDIALSVSDPTTDTVELLLDDGPIVSDSGYLFRVSTSTADHLYAQLTPSTTYYLRVGNDDDAAQDNRRMNYAVTVTTSVAPPTGVSEGSQASPLALSLNSDHTFSVGGYGSGYATSYYQFTTTGAGDYAADLEISSLMTYLYSDPAFSNLIDTNTYGFGDQFTDLAASATYYLKLVNSSSDRALALGRVVDEATMEATRENEGSQASPVTLSLGTPRSAKVGKNSYDFETYYSFTTGSEVDYTLSAPSIGSSYGILALLSTNAEYTGVLFNAYLASGIQVREVLSPHTTYYLQLKSMRMSSNTAVPFTIQIDATPVTSFVTLPVQSTATSGSIAAPQAVVWYQADVVPGNTYTLSWTNGSVGSTGASAFQEDRSTAYFRDQGAYNSPETIVIPSGQTKLYVRIRVPGASGNTGNFTVKLE